MKLTYRWQATLVIALGLLMPILDTAIGGESQVLNCFRARYSIQRGSTAPGDLGQAGEALA